MRARMHARQRRNAGRIARVAHRRDGSLAVAEFALSPGYCLVDALLAAASEALIRFAAQHKIPVPVTRWTRVQNTELGTLAAQKVTASEPNAVQAYRPQRFGTAPLRRYLDLMTLRQISLYLEYGAEAPLLTRAQVARIAAQVQRNASAGMQKVVASRQSLMLDVLAERQSQVQRLGPGELVLNGLVASVSSNGGDGDPRAQAAPSYWRTPCVPSGTPRPDAVRCTSDPVGTGCRLGVGLKGPLVGFCDSARQCSEFGLFWERSSAVMVSQNASASRGI